MKVTSELANKIVKQLEMKKSDILNDQKRNAFYEKFPDEESVEIPDYNFNETQNEIEKIDNSIMEIKHCINVFNSTTKVNNMDIQYGQAAVFTPSDFAFPSNAIKGEATPNTEMTLIVDVDLNLLKELHHNGAVRTMSDRRRDLYTVGLKEN